MGIVLGVPHELLAAAYNYKSRRFVRYCERAPEVFLDVGFGTPGIGDARIEIRLDGRPECKDLIANFVKLCEGRFLDAITGKPVGYKNTSFFSIDSTEKMVVGGDVVYDNGCGSRAASDDGAIAMERNTGGEKYGPGAVVMLPSAHSPSIYGSQFYIQLCDTPAVDGALIGHVYAGLDSLASFVDDYGTPSSIPKRRVCVMECGRVKPKY